MTYYFNCNKWLGLGVGDGLLERTLVADENDPRKAYTQYRLDFHTSKIRGAGTDANVYFQVGGSCTEAARKLDGAVRKQDKLLLARRTGLPAAR